MKDLNNIDFKYKPPQITKLGDLENLLIKNVYSIFGAAECVEDTKTCLGKASLNKIKICFLWYIGMG